ncbi:MAG: 3-hydroxyacyl-CoA dehydrogenase NAD-binding domain-containing protein [Porticoccaceae bacterium]
MTESPTVVTTRRHGAIALITTDAPPVNALGLAVRQQLVAAIDGAMADPGVKAVVLICAGRTFFAGADIKELGAPPVSPKISEINALIEDSPKPVIAAIHGNALGGGLELALSCHYRIATRSAKCGLTEVTLGILPGAGGTQRLPRVVGVARALDMIAHGKPIAAPEALAIGLVDALAADDHLLDEALAFAATVVAEGRPLRRVRDRDEKLAEARENPALFAQFRRDNARKFHGLAAPEINIQAVEAAVSLPFDEGLKQEKVLYAQLVAGPQPAALQYAFFAERQIAKIPGLAANIQPREFRRIGVVGAGTMGGGIAMNFAAIGLPVTLLETSAETLERGLAVIRRNYDSSARKGRMTEAQVEASMAQLRGTLDVADLADCDLVIEAVFENMAVKKDIFARLDRAVKPGAILASNTSFLDIEEIAAATERPERVLGMHFFSPANIMKLLEVVRTSQTAPEAIVSVLALGKRIGKTPVLVGNCHGFVGNRIINQRKTQGQALLLEGALPWQVDRVLTDFGFPMGPFAMSDMAGLDIGWVESESRSETLRDILCEQGRRGQKTGAGYYDYDANRRATPSPVTEKIIADFLAARGIAPRPVGDQEIVERCIYPMINEACKVLAEGIAVRASDIDVIMVQGYGFPRYRGGLTYFADQEGLDKVLAIMQKLERALGDTMKPAPLLEQLAREGGRLHKFAREQG